MANFKEFFGLTKLVYRFISWQLYLLYHYLDPIASSSTPEGPPPSSQWNWKLSFGFLTVLFTVLYGIVGLPLLYGARFNWRDLYGSAAVLFRQIHPPETWAQTDLGVSITIVAALAIYASLWRNPWTIDRYVKRRQHGEIVLLIGRTVVNVEASKKILQYHRNFKKTSFIVVGIFISFLLTVLETNIFVNGYYVLSMNLVLVCALVLPMYIIYVFYCKAIFQNEFHLTFFLFFQHYSAFPYSSFWRISTFKSVKNQFSVN